MKIPKYIIIIVGLAFIGLVGYIWFIKSSQNIDTIATSSEAEVVKGVLTDNISVTGKAALANEQKLKFWQTGKISEIFVKVGDSVSEGDVLASLDKRNFFQEMAQAQNELEKIDRNIAEEKKKATGPEVRQLERNIASMERKLEEMQEDFEKVVKNSPWKSQEKVLDLNTKKRELETLKDKYNTDLTSYEKEEKNQNDLIDSKVREGRKIVENIIKNTPAETSEMRQIHRNINKIFVFDISEATSLDRSISFYVGRNDPGRRDQVELLWRDSRKIIDEYAQVTHNIERNSQKTEDARGLVNESLRVYKKLLETLDNARSAAEASQVVEDSSFTRADLDKITSEISTLRNSVNSKISALNELKENLILIDSPEKIKEKFLLDLKNKKTALEKLSDDIKRAEIQISQEENNIKILPSGAVEDASLKREIAEKQSAIQDQKDNILTKKEELQKMQSWKSDTLENLLTSRKNQVSEIEKLKTREESFEIRAPFSGTIRAIKMQIGDVLGGSNSSSNDDEKMILLENSEIINIKLALNQLDIVKVSLGQEANISFEAVPEAILKWKIVEISSTPSGWGDSWGLSTYDVIIAAERNGHPIYSWMNALVDISLDSSTEALLVPITAVSEDPVTFEKYVNVVEANGNIKKTIVQTGKTNKSQIEITSGLEEWQKVLVIDFSANQFNSEDFSPSYGF